MSRSCTDRNGLSVPEGETFFPYEHDPCHNCLCNEGSPVACKSVMCKPPPCKTYESVPDACCQYTCIGIPELTTRLPAMTAVNHTDLTVRIMASALTSILMILLVIFMMYRLRRQRMVLLMRNLQLQTMSEMTEIPNDQFELTSSYPYIGYQEPPPPYTPPKPDDLYNDEPPPPYESFEESQTASDERRDSSLNNTALMISDEPQCASVAFTEGHAIVNSFSVGNGAPIHGSLNHSESQLMTIGTTNVKNYNEMHLGINNLNKTEWMGTKILCNKGKHSETNKLNCRQKGSGIKICCNRLECCGTNCHCGTNSYCKTDNHNNGHEFCHINQEYSGSGNCSNRQGCGRLNRQGCGGLNSQGCGGLNRQGCGGLDRQGCGELNRQGCGELNSPHNNEGCFETIEHNDREEYYGINQNSRRKYSVSNCNNKEELCEINRGECSGFNICNNEEERRRTNKCCNIKKLPGANSYKNGNDDSRNSNYNKRQHCSEISYTNNREDHIRTNNRNGEYVKAIYNYNSGEECAATLDIGSSDVSQTACNFTNERVSVDDANNNRMCLNCLDSNHLCGTKTHASCSTSVVCNISQRDTNCTLRTNNPLMGQKRNSSRAKTSFRKRCQFTCDEDAQTDRTDARKLHPENKAMSLLNDLQTESRGNGQQNLDRQCLLQRNNILILEQKHFVSKSLA